jgi:hypothetical protein
VQFEPVGARGQLPRPAEHLSDQRHSFVVSGQRAVAGGQEWAPRNERYVPHALHVPRCQFAGNLAPAHLKWRQTWRFLS